MNTVLGQIRRGMLVIDQTLSPIGTVDSVKFSEEDGVENAALNPIRRNIALTQNYLDKFDPEDVPQELWERLMREGFVRVDSKSRLQKDRYILPHQIRSVSVTENEVRLNVTKAALVKRS